MDEVKHSSEKARKAARSQRPLDLPQVLVEVGKAGDHVLIDELLQDSGLPISRNEFQATLDDPLYEPTDRLLIRENGRIASHLLLTKRTIQFGAVELPVIELKQLATRPEFRGRGYAGTLMREADLRMSADGSTLALLRTPQPEHLQPWGWTACNCTLRCQTSVHDLLTHLKVVPPRRKRANTLTVRVWRQVELGSLASLYQQATFDQYGPVVRSEAQWRWLIGRQAYDQILVAIKGRDSLGFGKNEPRIVGYAIVAGDSIVELLVDPTCKQAAVALLERAGREAMEQDTTTLEISTPPQKQAGFFPPDLVARQPSHASTAMFKVLQPEQLARQLFHEWQRRALSASIELPCEFTLQLGAHFFKFTLTNNESRIEVCPPSSQPDLRTTTGQLGQLLCGQLRLTTGDSEAHTFAARNDRLANQLVALFPPLVFWRSAFDDLEAC